MLCRLADLKTHLGWTHDTDDEALTRLIASVSAAMARECGRVLDGRPCLERAAGRVQYVSPEPRQQTLHLAAWPVVTVAEVIEAVYDDFADSTALTAGDDYWVNEGQGLLQRVGRWWSGRETVRVTYEGGYSPAAAWAAGVSYTAGDRVTYDGAVYRCTDAVSGTTAPDADTDHWGARPTEHALPEDLRGHCMMQVIYEFNRRRDPGLVSTGASGASAGYGEPVGLLDSVRDVCRGYRRLY